LEILQGIRDVAVIVLALESIILGAALLLLAWQVWKIVGRVRHHLDVVAGSAQDILGTVKETAGSVKETAQSTQGTAEFVGDRAARPVI
jgi:methyl-accepting chemotaxis protein